MKKTLLILSLCASMFASHSAKAQDETPYTLTVFNQAVYYGMYEATVSEPLPEGAIRHSNSSYGKKLTQDQLDSFGNTLTMTVTLNPLCDNYDRIGNVNLAFVPKNAESYVYGDVKRIELGRFITPFMDKNETSVTEVPYVYDLNELANVFHDAAITAQYDFWVELEVYGYQGGPGQGGAAVEIPGCSNRNDVYMGSLTFESTTNPELPAPAASFIGPLSFKYELKNYTLDGTDEIGETTKSIYFNLSAPVENAKLHVITSNHGSNTNGEEYIRRNHFVYLDDVLKLQYKPGGVSCVPYRDYNTQINCIYYLCNGTSNPPPRPDNNASWSWNNWCPGDKIPNRVIDLGTLAAGGHTYKIDVPDAQFAGGQGYFPMSVYLTGDGSAVLSGKAFEQTAVNVYPNPVNDIATISAADQTVKAYEVVNTVGQTVLKGSSETINMSQLQSGIYIVKVTFDNNQTITKKIIKN
ncbi:peptide-N-glycosidase F-related protein [Flavobacterium sp. DG1-102-2]|uniref:peptide-N-glycosidase F-related protein n=1 Tax=Flavobacterium sp. DG1-102-2 TaxID=3081663 RepID=UPI00294A499B|nr:peptide-N-glycosidase F-related protein [Flavobacterium sp. DG1-102-2]MDV6169898.1 peptide-N-glycosidase F-related protein [Flavobacterium sp. DG1-102-2]